MSTIININARQILNSRGNPTIQTWVETENGSGMCSVPTGASAGTHEAVDRRDGGTKFGGRTVLRAVEDINSDISETLTGTDVERQEQIDDALRELDGTDDKHTLGANAILSVSVAAARAAASEADQSLAGYIEKAVDGDWRNNSAPTIYANLLNGGEHASASFDLQEILVVMQTNSIHEAIENIWRIQTKLSSRLQTTFATPATAVGDEGGFVAPFADSVAAIDMLDDISPEGMKIGIDAAANELQTKDGYHIDGDTFSESELQDFWLKLINKYPISYLEDPFAEDAFADHSRLRSAVTADIIGDDLTTTNKKRIKKASENNCIDGVIIKPNQIGTITETIEAVQKAKENGLSCIASHRSGETNDDFIVDLGVGLGCDGLKIGALQRGERIAKYNRLLSLYDRK